jgi:hypothetical protein
MSEHGRIFHEQNYTQDAVVKVRDYQSIIARRLPVDRRDLNGVVTGKAFLWGRERMHLRPAL